MTAPRRSADWVPATPQEWTPAPAPAWAAPAWPPPPTATQVPLRPVQGLRRALAPLLAAYVGLQALNLLLLFTVPAWGQVAAPLDGVDLAYYGFAILGSGVYIPTIVVFCIWLHRVCSNAKARRGLLDVSPGWAVGSFFIPFVQLVAPYFAVRKAYVADVSADTRPLLSWFLPWAIVNAVGYLGAIVLAVMMVSMLADADFSDEASAQEATEEIGGLGTRYAQWIGAPSLALTATAAWFLARLARSWSDLQEPPAS